MTNDELSKFIKNYIENDKTHTAIMLTSPWGTGKSYYIQHHLLPFLENGGYKCIVVYLYGLKTLFDINKELFFEAKHLNLKKKSSLTGVSIFAAKTIVRGVTSFSGIDLSKFEEDLDKLYKSIDLSGKLIIFENIERTSIDIIELLGYVNNLVEQNEVKVLLVANEKELLNYVDSTSDNSDKKSKIPDERTKLYLKAKEKSVGDTIQYIGDLNCALDGILRSFENKILDELLDSHPIIDDILSIMDNVKCHNLRSVIFGIQKTVDLYQYIKDDFDKDFLASLLCSNIAFALRLKMDDILKWDSDDDMLSPDLGTSDFPLLRTAYDFITTQKNPEKELITAHSFYCSQKKLENSQAEIRKHLNTIYKFYDHFENEVADALNHVTNNLETTDDISISEFGRLASFLVAVHQLISHDDEIRRCRAAMIRRLKCNSEQLTEDYILLYNYDAFELDKKGVDELSNWKKDMISILQKRKELDSVFDYRPENIDKFYEFVCKNRNDFLSRHYFASMFDVRQLIGLLKKASPEQVGKIYSIFHAVYSFENINEYLSTDKEALTHIKESVDDLITHTNITDRIVLFQLRNFVNNLQLIINRLK